ncbi:hypothetical protein C0991_011115 [Blastosporella zonata]|nr:hypothetical protein C0991_011115 [Blastosporella zonata]
MEEPSIYDDEIIPDSDQEENGFMLAISRENVRAILQEKIPPIITQDTIQTAPRTIPVKQSPISSASNATTDSRPKPRPLKKPAAQGNHTFSDIQLDTDFSMSNIAERAKMRSRTTKSQVQQPNGPTRDIIELSSDDDDDFEILPASKRRKAAEKSKAKSKKKSKSSSGSVDVFDPKPRPRPRPLKKSAPGKSSDPISPIDTRSQDNPASSILNDTFPIPFKLVPSQLPPSDPPSSTAITHNLPPIETLGEPSSQPSLFSSGKKKWKRVLSNVDELDSDPDLQAGSAIDVDTQFMPPPPLPGPPPTFFAGSSSPTHDDRPPAASSIVIKIPAAKKPRKKNFSDFEGDDGAWGTSKPPAKQKKKALVKKVEVLIQRSKGKGKEKKTEVFNSREFVDDEDDDDLLDQVATSTSKKPDSLTSLSSVPPSDIDELGAAGPSRKRKPMDQNEDELDTIGMKEGSTESKRRTPAKGKKKMVIESDEEDNEGGLTASASHPKATSKAKGKNKPDKAKATPKPAPLVESDDSSQPADKESQISPSSKENTQPPPASGIPQTPKPLPTPNESLFPSLSSRYTIAPKTKPTPMSDLIRRVNSKPGSPFVSPASRGGGARPMTPGTAYSPYVKASRSALSRIAPLHPNRRTPPPPLPPPPPKKKTKKELEREEQWEEELVESVGGITEWACMPDAERKEMRRAKREREMYGWED